MKINLKTFGGGSRVKSGVGLFKLALPAVVAACLFSVSSAEASVTLWSDPTPPSPTITVGGTASYAITFNSSAPNYLINVNLSYAMTGNTGNVQWTLNTVNIGSVITDNSSVGFSHIELLPSYVNGANTLTATITGSSGNSVTFTGISLTADVVPEPINYALAGFGLIS